MISPNQYWDCSLLCTSQYKDAALSAPPAWYHVFKAFNRYDARLVKQIMYKVFENTYTICRKKNNIHLGQRQERSKEKRKKKGNCKELKCSESEIRYELFSKHN